MLRKALLLVENIIACNLEGDRESAGWVTDMGPLNNLDVSLVYLLGKVQER
jgi:hypothetical protein